MTVSEPLSPSRESGIRLFCEINSKNGPETEVGMLEDLLSEMDRLRHELQGRDLQLSVHERRSRLSKSKAFTGAEESMLQFALDCAKQVKATAEAGFTEMDTAALERLRQWMGLT
jgi:hypothetical protein